MPKVITRFPPEPNGYLHIGHAKSICLNFGLARDYDGRCHLRFDDTIRRRKTRNLSIRSRTVSSGSGFPGEQGGTAYVHYASDYFDTLYLMAEYLVEAGHAYVDSQTPEEIAKNRGVSSEAGKKFPLS